MDLPSGDQALTPSTYAFVVRRRTARVASVMMYASSTPSRLLLKATCFPSGDHAQQKSAKRPSLSGVTVPSASIRRILLLLLKSGGKVLMAIRLPSGEKLGSN